MKAIWTRPLFLLIFAALGLAGCDSDRAFHGQRAGPIGEAQTAATFLQPDPSDVVYGQADAPLSIYIFSSYTCPACARVQEYIMPLLDEAYVEPGRVKVIFRDFPLDRTALAISQMAQCVSDPDRYYRFVRETFASQDDWAGSDDPVGQVAATAPAYGLSASGARACAENQAIENFILWRANRANQLLKISGTPVIYLNQQRLDLRDDIPAQIEAALARI